MYEASTKWTSGMARIWIGLVILLTRSSHTNGDQCRFGEGCMFPCHCEGGRPCDPKTGDCGDLGCDDGEIGDPGDSVYVTPWAGPGCQIGNVGFEKAASQGPRTEQMYQATYSIDGNHDPNSGGQSCSWVFSSNDDPAWWMVDLGDEFIIYNITITTRNIHSNYLSDTDVGTSLSNGDFSFYNFTACEGISSRDPGPEITLQCQPNTLTRFVLLQDTQKLRFWYYLQMCEVEILGFLYRECGCPGSSPGCLHCPSPLAAEAVGLGPGIIAGSVVGVLLAILIVVGIAVFLNKRGLLRKLRSNSPTILPGAAPNTYYNTEVGYTNEAFYTEVLTDKGVAGDGMERSVDGTSSHYQEIDSILPCTSKAIAAKRPNGNKVPEVVISAPLRDDSLINPASTKPAPAATASTDYANVANRNPDLAYANMHIYNNEAPVTRAIPLCDLRQYLRDVRKNQKLLMREFQMLPKGIKATELIGSLPENQAKNRFNNIIAYNHSRVILNDGHPGDYVNANYVTIPGKREMKYIATQAPRAQTVGDFWRMVWQSGANRIVMLTNLYEGGKKQCSHYWPDFGSMESGLFTITLVSKTDMADYTIRTLAVAVKGQKSRCVLHFQFTGWPDKGVPLMASSLLDFRRKIRAHDDLADGPLIVHCSAGVGRTGAFIALDACMEQAQSEGQVDIFKVAGIMRTNRPEMIQTMEQYLFVHDALLEATVSADTCIPCSELDKTFKALLVIDPKTKRHRLHQQYQVLESLKPPPEPNHPRGLSPHNIHKNRFHSIVPRDSRRPVLSTVVREKDCNDYVNAVYIDGYRCRRAYIATQLPLETTAADFWRLVYDHDVCSVVLLHGMSGNAQDYPIYWPEDPQQHKSWSPLSVKFVESTPIKDDNITIREFNVTNSKRFGVDEPEHTVKQFHLESWSPEEDIPSTMQDLFAVMDLVQRWQQQTKNKPIIVQCVDGNKHTGLFCAASYMLEKLKSDQEVDVFLAVKQARLARPQFIPNETQFKFLYDVAVAYMETNDMYANFK